MTQTTMARDGPGIDIVYGGCLQQNISAGSAVNYPPLSESGRAALPSEVFDAPPHHPHEARRVGRRDTPQMLGGHADGLREHAHRVA